MEAQSTAPAPEIRPSRRYRRFDKSKLLLLAVIGAAIPSLLCWGMPTLLAQVRSGQQAASQAAEQAVAEEFQADYGALIAFCDREDEPVAAVQPPQRLSVLAVRHGEQAAAQADLPAEWQPEGPSDVTVVLCLGREVAKPVEACAGGQTADLTRFHGYEIQWQEEIASHPGYHLPGDSPGKHPNRSGHQIFRYATPVIAYDAAGEQVIAFGTLWGGDPEVCQIEDMNQVEELNFKMLYGPRITAEALVDGLAALLGQ